MRATDEIIAGRVANGAEPAHQRYVISIFGLYARKKGTSLPIAKVVELLEQVGIEPTSVRSSVSRLKKRDVLQQSGPGSYEISADALQHFERRNARIYGLPQATEGGQWLLLSFSVPESERQARHLLRSGLQRMGFGTVSAGLWVAPDEIYEEAQDYFDEHDLNRYVELFRATYVNTKSLKQKVSTWWDLEEIESHYAEFLNRHRRAYKKWEQLMEKPPTESNDRDAFIAHLHMFTQWRALPFLDPGLPASVLPKNWKGYAAHQLFTQYHELIFAAATRHIQRVLNTL